MIDCHIHSLFSADSEMDMQVACEKAIEIGLSGLGFTDHLDYDYPGFEAEHFFIDFKKYCETLSILKEQYSGKLKLLTGIEAGLQPHVIEPTQKVVCSHEFDYVIHSVHIIDGEDPYIGDFYQSKTKNEAYSRYLEVILQSLEGFSDFDMLGHIDYIIRYGSYDDRSLYYKDHIDLIDQILKKLIIMGKGMELNTASYRHTSKAPIPEYDIMLLKRFKELGGEFVCLGSDAHYPEFVGYKFDYYKEVIKSAGFDYLTHFEKRRNKCIKI